MKLSFASSTCSAYFAGTQYQRSGSHPRPLHANQLVTAGRSLRAAYILIYTRFSPHRVIIQKLFPLCLM